MSSTFISYSSKDKAFALHLAKDLKQNGVSVWLDEWEIKVGDEIRQKIEHGIENFEFFIIVLSQHSIESNWVQKELNAAYLKEVDNHKIKVLPVKIEDCKIPLLISGKRYADFTDTYTKGFNDLMAVLAPEEPIIHRQPIKHVLIIHDDIMFGRSVGKYLSHLGYQVSATYDLLPALELAKRQPPDLILMDVWFGMAQNEQAWEQVISRFKQASPDAKIIGITSYEMPKQLREMFDDILQPHLTFDEIEGVLNKIERKWP
jgi:CheY-like chemotaxis protein